MKKVYSIHPAIGIARVGNSGVDHLGRPTPEMYFIGPEAPGFGFRPTGYDGSDTGEGAGNYRDRSGALRRQGARFRIYETTLDEMGQVVSVREINNSTPGVQKITWTVHVVNNKGAAERFPPYFHDQWGSSGPLRNPGVSERKKLKVDSGAKKVPSGSTGHKKLGGKFIGRNLKLGDAFTDSEGRLIFLGGHGIILDAAGLGLGQPTNLPHAVYNHDGVCDDTCDGKITASVKFEGEQAKQLDQPDQVAWVIVAPPNHAPAVQSVVTLYDISFNANLSHLPPGDERAIPAKVSFTRDIYPLLRRTVDFQYVSERTRMGHSGQAFGNFFLAERFKVLSTKPADPKHKRAREHFVSRMTTEDARQQEIDMPFLYGGVYPETPQRKPQDWLEARDATSLDAFGKPLMVTAFQRQVLTKWAQGLFDEDWPGSPPPYRGIDEFPEEDRPHALLEAALEHGSGGSFHPGIEAPYLFARPDTFGHWFRIAAHFQPGDLTMGLSQPWHTDFAACSELWWPAQRPNSVPVLEDGKVKHEPWLRGQIFRYEQLPLLGIIKYDPDKDMVIELEREIADD